MPNQTKFKIGDRVIYSDILDHHPTRTCIITGVGEHHGEPIYDNDLGAWGYEDQYELVN